MSLTQIIKKWFKRSVTLDMMISKDQETIEQSIKIPFNEAESIEFGNSFIGIFVSNPDKDGTFSIGFAMTEIIENEPVVVARSNVSIKLPFNFTIQLNNDKNNTLTTIVVSSKL